MKKWSRKYNKCIRCGRVRRKHKGGGLCINCFDSDRKKNTNSRIVQANTRNKYRKEIRERQRKWYLKVREEMFMLLGNKCVKCGFSDRRALQIDHINGGGIKERGKGGCGTRQFHLNVLKSTKKKEKKYQLLCANCNWIKRAERGEWGGAPKKHI